MKSAGKNSLESLSFHQEPSSGRIEASIFRREDEGQSCFVEGKIRRKGAKSFGKICQKSEWTVEILKGRIAEVMWTFGSYRSVEGLRMSVFQHSQAQEE